MYKTTFILGETKKVRLKITSTLGEDFKISSGMAKLTCEGQPDLSFYYTIEPNNILSVKITPKNLGTHILSYNYMIEDETFKTNIEINVVAQ